MKHSWILPIIMGFLHNVFDIHVTIKILFDTGTTLCLLTLWQLVWYWDHTTGFVLSRKNISEWNAIWFSAKVSDADGSVAEYAVSPLCRWLSNRSNLEWRVLLLNCNRYLSVGSDFALDENHTHLRFYADFRTHRVYLLNTWSTSQEYILYIA